MGLEKTAYNVSEDVGEVEVCAVVRNVSSCYIPFRFSINMSTVDESAGIIVTYTKLIDVILVSLCRIYQWK